MQWTCRTPCHYSAACSWLTLSRAQKPQKPKILWWGPPVPVLLRIVILSLTGHPNLLGSFSKRKDARLSPESESQRMEPTFICIYITFFLGSLDTPGTSQILQLWATGLDLEAEMVSHKTHTHTHFCDCQSSLPIFSFRQRYKNIHRYSGLIGVSESLNSSISLQGFLKSGTIAL